jgi:hypothetical protein
VHTAGAACSRTRARVRLGHSAGSGMTGGPRLSAAAGAKEWAVGWAAVRHWAAVAQASQSKQLEGRQRTSGCWAANKNGPEEGKAEGEEEKGFDQFEKSTSK